MKSHQYRKAAYAGDRSVPRHDHSRVRTHRLAIALSLALLSHGAASVADVDQPHIPQPLVVKNCDDSGPDSLRDIILHKAQSGNAIDLSQLSVPCGTNDAVITLTTGEIAITRDTLTLTGPSEGTVTISGGDAYRVFHHTGTGALSLNSLRIVDGRYHGLGDVRGGCIASDIGGVHVYDSVVSDCHLVSESGYSMGGAIGAMGPIKLTDSVISGSEAKSLTVSAFGGGVFAAGGITSEYSTIQGNSVAHASGYFGSGGGLFSASGADIGATTIADNEATYGAAAFLSSGQISIADSTISGNSSDGPDVLRIVNVDSATIANSTIAFNTMAQTPHPGAVYFNGVSIASKLLLQSSIIGANAAGANKTPADLYFYAGVLDPSGKDNLVVASNVASPPADVITVKTDPKLGPLAWNGGKTQTHQLLSDSPARDKGNNDAALPLDQRGAGYPRTTGAGAKVDMGAVQFDRIFVDGMDP